MTEFEKAGMVKYVYSKRYEEKETTDKLQDKLDKKTDSVLQG